MSLHMGGGKDNTTENKERKKLYSHILMNENVINKINRWHDQQRFLPKGYT